MTSESGAVIFADSACSFAMRVPQHSLRQPTHSFFATRSQRRPGGGWRTASSCAGVGGITDAPHAATAHATRSVRAAMAPTRPPRTEVALHVAAFLSPRLASGYGHAQFDC